VTQIIEALGNWIIGLIESSGYAGVALLMAIESACIPLPSEIIMPFAGYLASRGELTLWGVAVAGAVGCNLGSTIAYAIGSWGGRPFVEKWGRLVLLSNHDLDAAERFFARFGSLAVFVGRLLPVVRTFIALPAGFARMSMWRFQLYTFVGSLIWCLLLAYIGAALGAQWDQNPFVKTAFHSADAVILVLAIVAIGWFVWHRLRSRQSS
jgi:membrane protein DedA with SNARE-associated domain